MHACSNDCLTLWRHMLKPFMYKQLVLLLASESEHIRTGRPFHRHAQQLYHQSSSRAYSLPVCNHTQVNIQQMVYSKGNDATAQMLTTESLAAGAPCCSKPRTADHSCGTTAAVAEPAALLLAVAMAVTMAVSSCSICTVGARVSTCTSA